MRSMDSVVGDLHGPRDSDFSALGMRSSFDSSFAPSVGMLEPPERGTEELNGALTALQVLLDEAPSVEDVRSPVASSRAALDWHAPQALVRRPRCLRAQVVKTQQAISHAIEGIIRSLEDSSITEAASICCHVERLPRQLNVAAAPASGPKPGVQSDQGFYECYEELDTGGELDASTWVHTKGVRTQDVKGVHTKLLYSCLHIQKTISPLKDHELEKHLKVLCSISHPHLCKVVECFDAGDERLLISEKPFEDRLVTSFAGSPWTREKEPSLEPSQMRKDEKVIAEMLRQVLSALAHGHARGCIHGMLTPDKFRIGSSKSRASRIPQVKILGFGLGYALVPPLGFFIQKELSKDRNMTGKREGVPYTAAESLISKDQFLERLRNCLQSQGEPLMSSEVSKATPRLAVQADGPAEEARPRTQADLHLIDGHLRGLAPEGADKADIWAVGALAYRLLTGVPPFLPSREGAKKDLKQAEPIKFSKSDWESRSSKCLDAVRCMLRVTSSLRPSAAEMLRHPWLKLAREPVPLVRMHRLFANSLNFLKESQFKKLIIRVIAEQMPEVDSHLEQANSVFRALDRDRDALLSPAEFMQAPAVIHA
ncbi:unnamed protein product [Effrenium voratum]|nr:unnamed protein product [Effrenium voratum]